MPTDIKSVIADEKFQALAPGDQQQVLAKLDPKFASLSSADQAQVINHISNTVMIGGVPVNLKTGAGASTAANSQTQQASSAAVHPVSKSAGILQSGPTYVPDSNDTSATIAPSGSTDFGIPGNLSGKIRTQSLNQVDQNAKQGLIAAGLSLAPELIPEVGGAGVGGTLLNAGIRGGNAAISGAGATVAGQALTGESPLSSDALKETGTNAAIGAALGAGSKAIEAIPGAVKGAVNVAKDTFGEVKPPTPGPELPAPVSNPVTVDSPFDDAVIRKGVGGKDLSPSARELLRNNSGPVITAGSSPEVHLLKAVAPTNEMIATEGAKLDGILKNAPPLPEAPAAKVSAALENLRDNLPGGTSDSLGKAIDRVQERYADALKSTDPKTLNQTIRDLDQRISDYGAPESQLEGPASVQDAALVLVRRTLRNSLNEAIPETQPINKQLSDAIEVRSLLRKKFGNVATDSSAANSQYQSELAKGQAQIAKDTANEAAKASYDANVGRIKRNRTIAGVVGGGATLSGVGKLAVDKVLSSKP